MKPSEALKKCGSDKVMGYPSGHWYGQFYDELFAPFREPINILEVGVLGGASLRAWRMAFPDSKITGIDVIDVSLPKEFGITLIKDDIKNVTLTEKYDVIIDDSSHDLKESLYEIQHFCKNLTDKGVMVIEDIQIPDLYMSEMLKVLPEGFILQGHDFRPMFGGQKHDDFIVKITRA